jgi:hypothetical protein
MVRRRRSALTYAHEEEEDEEHVEHGEERHGKGRDDLLERLDAAEEADDAESAEDADDARGLVGDDEGHDRHCHDESVKNAPGILDEWPEPVGEGVDGELGCEEEGEEEVEVVECARELRRHAVFILEVLDELRLGDCAPEVLLERTAP